MDNSKKNFLMFANWPSGKLNKDKNLSEVERIISIITAIRSFKNELNVSPGSFIDISIHNIKKNNQSFFKSNEIVIKKLGRISIGRTFSHKPIGTIALLLPFFILLSTL